MNINTKLLADRNIASKSLVGLFIGGGVILLSFLMFNLEVVPSPWAHFFTFCKWMTMFLFLSIYCLMAKDAYVYVMKWVDAQQIEAINSMEPEQENAIN